MVHWSILGVVWPENSTVVENISEMEEKLGRNLFCFPVIKDMTSNKPFELVFWDKVVQEGGEGCTGETNHGAGESKTSNLISG